MPDSSDARRTEHTESPPFASRSLSLALFGLPDLPDLSDLVPDVQGIIEDGIEWLFFELVGGLLDALVQIFSVGFETFLFYPNPAGVEVLDTLWWISFGAFGGVAALSFMYMLLLAQLFPGTSKADLQYHLEQVAKYFVVIFLSRETMAFFVDFTHALAGIYYRAGYDLSLGVTIARDAVEPLNPYAAIALGTIVTLVLLVAGLGFILVLVARMFVIYLTYALLPLLMAFQLVEVGPWKMINDMGEKFLKASAKLMLFGLLVTSLLWTSTLVWDFDDYDSDRTSFATGEETEAADARFDTPDVGVIQDLLMFVTPLLVINFLGFQMLMEIL